MPLYSTGQIKAKALSDLQNLLYSQKKWVKVHVAEFLLWEGYCVDEVKKEFIQEEKQFGQVPKYRIGVWRVLTQAERSTEKKQEWINKIIQAYQNLEGEDRLHAIETLAKLKVPVIKTLDSSLEGSMRLYSLWNYALNSRASKQEVRSKLVEDLKDNHTTESEMLVISYILRDLSPLSDDEFLCIFEWLQDQNFKPSLRSALLAMLSITYPREADKKIVDTIKADLIALKSQRDALSYIMAALSVWGDVDDKEVISSMYNSLTDTSSPDYDSDLHATLAYMVLRASSKYDER